MSARPNSIGCQNRPRFRWGDLRTACACLRRRNRDVLKWQLKEPTKISVLTERESEAKSL